MSRSIEVTDLNRQLSNLGDVLVWINEYRLTHGNLHLVLTNRSWRRMHLHLSECDYVCGHTTTEYCKVVLLNEKCEDKVKVVFTAGDGRLIAKASRAQLSEQPAKVAVELTIASQALNQLITIVLDAPVYVTPEMSGEILHAAAAISAMMADGEQDRTEEMVERFESLAKRYPACRPAADTAAIMRTRASPH